MKNVRNTRYRLPAINSRRVGGWEEDVESAPLGLLLFFVFLKTAVNTGGERCSKTLGQEALARWLTLAGS